MMEALAKAQAQQQAAAEPPKKRGPLTPAEQMAVKKKKIWEVATSPRKQMMMMLFMMWMIGNELNIFPILFTAQAVYTPITAILGVSKTFEKVVEGVDSSKELQKEIETAKLTFIAHHLVFFCIGIVKCYYMGLVPTNALDWIDHRPYHPTEFAVGF